MQRPLTLAEAIVAFTPLLIPICAFILVKKPKSSTVGGELPSLGGTHQVPLVGTRWFWNIFCLVVAASAGWALAEALISAAGTGFVSLPGRRGHPRPFVPWPHAWAYIAGLTCVVGGTVGSRFTPRTSRWYVLYAGLAALIVASGYFLILFSEIFSSLRTAAFVLAMFSALGLLAWVDRRYGRKVTIAVAAAGLLLAIYGMYSSI